MTGTELTRAQTILRPRIIILSLSIILSGIGILVWSIFARIPLLANGIAYILPAYEVRTLVSLTEGHSFFLDPKISSKIFNNQQFILRRLNTKTSWDRFSRLRNSSKINAFPNFDNVNSSLKQLHYYINTLETISVQSQSISSNDSITHGTGSSSNSVCYKSKQPIYFIDNQNSFNALRLQLQTTVNALTKLRSEAENSKALSSTYLTRVKTLGSRASVANKLSKDKLLPPSTSLDIQSEYLRSKELYLQLNAKKELSIRNFIDEVQILSTAFYTFSSSSFLSLDNDSCLIQKLAPNNSLVVRDALLAIAVPQSYVNNPLNVSNDSNRYDFAAHNSKDGIRRIPFFYSAENDRGIRSGNLAVIYPRNVPRNKFGGIRGRILTSRRILEDPRQTQWIVGFRNILPYNNSDRQNLMYYGVIQLEADIKTRTGYKWTSGDGPDFPINIGTTADVDITVASVNPISYLLPFLRTVSGQ